MRRSRPRGPEWPPAARRRGRPEGPRGAAARRGARAPRRGRGGRGSGTPSRRRPRPPARARSRGARERPGPCRRIRARRSRRPRSRFRRPRRARGRGPRDSRPPPRQTTLDIDSPCASTSSTTTSPADRIAQEARPRGASRLLVLDRRTGAVAHRTFADFPDLLAPGDLLVRNDVRVRPARLYGRDAAGRLVEIFLLAPLAEDRRAWSALARPGRRARKGSRISLEGAEALVGRRSRTWRPTAAGRSASTAPSTTRSSIGSATSRCRRTSAARRARRIAPKTARRTRPSSPAIPSPWRPRPRASTSRPRFSERIRRRGLRRSPT